MPTSQQDLYSSKWLLQADGMGLPLSSKTPVKEREEDLRDVQGIGAVLKTCPQFSAPSLSQVN